MNWLAQNWVWVVLGVGIAWFVLRGGHGGLLGGLGHGGHGGFGGPLGGLGHGGHGGLAGGHGGYDDQPEARAGASAPEAAIDPVGGEAVRTAQALTTVYQGKIYYFASKENRDRFEAAPQEYAHKAAGHPVRAPEAVDERPRRRGGC
jgi:YHS domain-containing protein